jgi:hypothetical protein
MVENHPFEPWLPENARLLMLGTFPPAFCWRSEEGAEDGRNHVPSLSQGGV